MERLDNWLLGTTRTAWVPGDIAKFNSATQGTAGITISSAVSVSGIQFAAGSWDIQANSGAVLQLFQNDTTNTIEDDSVQPVGSNAVINDTIEAPIVPVSGHTLAGLTVTGNALGGGDVALTNSSNTMPGGVLLTKGALTISRGAIDTAPIYVNPGSGNFVALTFQGGLGTATFSNAIDVMSGTVRFDTAGNDITLSGSLTGSGGLINSDNAGNGMLTFTGTNTGYSGSVSDVSGTLVLATASAVGTGSLTVNHGVLDLDGSTYTPSALTLEAGVITDGALGLASNFTANVAAGESAYIDATITGTGNLTVGSGTLFLPAPVNSYGSTSVSSGAELVYRYNNGTSNASIPGGAGSVTGAGTVASEYAYYQALDPSVTTLVWNDGDWDNGTLDWLAPYQSGTSAGANTVAWGTGDNAVFILPAYSGVNVGATVSVGDSLTFATGADTFSTTSSGEIDVSSTTLTNIIEDVQITEYFDVLIGGGGTSGGLNLTANGNIYLGDGSNSYAGTTQINAGAAVNFTQGALGTSMVKITAGTGGIAALVFHGSVSNAIDIDSGTLRIDPSDAAVTVTGTISGSGQLELGDSVGGGSLTLSPSVANSYSGGTFIHTGTLIVSADNALGALPSSPAVNVTFDDNGIFKWGANFALYVNRTIEIESGVTAELNTPFYSSGTAPSVPGVIAGAGNLSVTGNSTLTLSGANTFTGVTTVDASGETLKLANTAALGGSTFDTTGVGTLSFGTLTAATFGGLQGTGDLTLANAGSPAAPVDLTIGGNNASTTFAGTVSGSSSLIKTGTGLFDVIGSVNTTDLVVDAGIFIVDSSTALASGIFLSFGAYSTGIVQLNGNDVTLGSLSTDGINPGSPEIEVAGDSGTGTSVLTVSASSACTYAGSIVDGGSSGNAVQLIVNITGPLTLVPAGTNSNTFSGGTLVSSGELIVGNTSGLADGSNLTVGDDIAFGSVVSGMDFSRSRSDETSETTDSDELSSSSPLVQIEAVSVGLLNVIADLSDPTLARTDADLFSAATVVSSVILADIASNSGTRDTSDAAIAAAATAVFQAQGMTVTAASGAPNSIQAEAAAELAYLQSNIMASNQGVLTNFAFLRFLVANDIELAA